MLYSYNWLQKHIVEKLPEVEMLKEQILFHAFEVESIKMIDQNSTADWIMDIKVLPDRARDCLSHYGMAREIAGLLNLNLKPLEKIALPETSLNFPIKIESELCRQYIAVEIRNVSITDSPRWLKESIESVGLRSINNVVDATNYVLLDRGQPVHAYDKAKLSGSIIVRSAQENEVITTLSQEEKKLKPSDLVVADQDGVLAIAGIKGGRKGEITSQTKDIIVEIANFDGVSIRKSAKRLALNTDAAKRFENDLSPMVALEAAQMTAQLITEIAGGKIEGVFILDKSQKDLPQISFDVQDLQKILGSNIGNQEIEKVFNQYKYIFSNNKETYTLTVPVERQDLKTINDIAEEVGRVNGYDLIPAQNLPAEIQKNKILDDKLYTSIRAVKEYLAEKGYNEVLTYVFGNKGVVEIAHGVKGKNKLRESLLPALQESYRINKLNMPLLGMQEVKIFEVGTVFLKDEEEVRVGCVDASGAQEFPIEQFIKENSIEINYTIKQNNLENSSRFKPWSNYPFIVRDLAVWINKNSEEQDKSNLEKLIAQFTDEYCVRPAFIFDRFEKADKVSLAFRLVFQSVNQTLTEAEVDQKLSKLLSQIKDKGIFEIR